jgi:class 3 adenylate cyclase/tetratricopeptide (TPR) repeat protein
VARKVVTIVFADLVGSTALHERLDAESAGLFMERYYRAMRGAVEAHGGIVTQLLGDGVKAVFGAPRVAEDDALRAVTAAVEMQRAFHELAREQVGAVGRTGLRVAVNTGEVLVGDNSEIIGDPVNVAARLQEQGGDGDVVIGESTRRLVAELVTLKPLGTFRLKGRSEVVAAHRVVSLERPGGATATVFVGREDPLRRLMGVFEAAVAARGARLTAVLGAPGQGKSRLLAELARKLGARATFLVARCESAGGATFAPLVEAFRAVLPLDDGVGGETQRDAIAAVAFGDETERSRISAGMVALLAGEPASPEETFFVVRRFLTALAAEMPVVLAIDDLQWAEPLLLDLVEHLAQWTAAPLLLLAAARPELRAVRPSLAGPGGLVADAITLAGLDAGAATRLAASVLGADEIPAAIAGRVLAASEGNPLFIAELVRMLVHDGALRREGDRWTAGVELDSLEMPPTIQALLAARIERLAPEERVVLERAAVIGRHFSRAAVAHLVPIELVELEDRLEGLKRSELIELDGSVLFGEPVLRFHHLLTREAAYRRLLKGTRAELHGRFAEWLEARAGESVEHDEAIGWHFEQAHHYLRELAPMGERGRSLGERASRRLAAAGRRALARDDLPPAASLLGRALDALEAADPARAELALDRCEALLAAGDVALAAQAIAEIERFAASSSRLQAWRTCFAGQLAVLTDPETLRSTADAVAAAAASLGSLGDAAGEAKAHSVHATALARLGEIGRCEAALDRALEAARRAGDRRRASAVLAGAPLAALWGPSPVTRASGRCLDVMRVLRVTQGAPAVEAVALRCQAVLEALRGRTDAARRMVASARRMVEELGIASRVLEADVAAGLIELLDGDVVAAEGHLRGAYAGLRDQGLGIDAAQAAALLGRALLAQERGDEAEALSHEAEALAGDDTKAAIAWRGVRAEALARRHEHEAAVALARDAVAIAATTDALLDHADARRALAATLLRAGRPDEAAREESHALRLWEAKGATLLAGRASPAPDRVEGAQPRDAGHPGPRAPIPPNAATANAARLDAAIVARDAEAFPELLAADARTIHHPTGASWDREATLYTWRRLLAAENMVFRHEPVVTLGDSLAVCRSIVSFSGFAESDAVDFGAVRKDELVLIEVDEHGRRHRVEYFDDDHLSEALTRLYECYAGRVSGVDERARAEVTARSLAALLGPIDPVRFAAAISPDVEYADHRRVGFGAGRGVEGLLRAFRAAVGSAEDLSTRAEEVLGVRPDGLVVAVVTTGTERSGGRFEARVLAIWTFGPEGRLERIEELDRDRVAEALARFEELAPGPRISSSAAPAGLRDDGEVTAFARHDAPVSPQAPGQILNAATRAGDRFAQAWAGRDWDGVAATFAPGFRRLDRRSAAVEELDRERHLAALRSLWTKRGEGFASRVLATRGERLALALVRCASPEPFAKADARGSDRECLALTEVDDVGDLVSTVLRGPGDLEAAYAELAGRHEASEAASRRRAAVTSAFSRAFTERDWEAMVGLLSPDLVVNDHRLLGWEPLYGPAAYIEALKSLVELAPDVRLRIDHIRMSSPAFLYLTTWIGTREGGAFETPSAIVCRIDERGRIRSFDQYDTAQLDEARAHLDSLGASSTS